MTNINTRLKAKATLAVVATIVFSALENILPDSAKWISMWINDGEYRDDTIRVAIGATGLISVGSACVAAKLSEQSLAETRIAVFLAVVLTGHALIASSEDSHDVPQISDVFSDLYIVAVFFTLYLLVFSSASNATAQRIGQRLLSSVIGAFIGFLLGSVLITVIDFGLPRLINGQVRYIVHPPATLALATAWGMAVLPIGYGRASFRDVALFTVAAILLGIGYGLIGYTPGWLVGASLTIDQRFHLGTLTLLLTLPSVVTSVAYAYFALPIRQLNATRRQCLILTGVMAVSVSLSLISLSLIQFRTNVDLYFIRNLLIMGSTVLPLLTAGSFAISKYMVNTPLLFPEGGNNN